MKSIILLALLSATSLHAEFPSPLDPLSNAQLKPARRHEPRPQRLRTPSGPAKFGDPLIGLNKAQTDAFTTGLDEFTNVEDAAGGLMSPRFARLRPEMTADEAISYLRRQTTHLETIYYAYALDENQHLLGVVTFRDLKIHPTATPLRNPGPLQAPCPI